MRSNKDLQFLLNHLAFVISRQSDQILLERLGLGFSQYKIMQVLQEKPHIQQKEIAERLGQTEASVSRQTKLLVSQGLLQSIRRPEDKREHITALTLKGERYVNEATEILDSYHEPVFGSLTDKQQNNLIELLNDMHDRSCGDDRIGTCHAQ